MTLPLSSAQWLALVALFLLILLDAVISWIRNAAKGTFTWSKFALYVRKQFYVLGAAIVAAVVAKYGPPSISSLVTAGWWAGAIGVALQYVIGDILTQKLHLIPSTATSGLSTAAPKVPTVSK